MHDWENEVARFWAAADDGRPEEVLAGIRRLVAQRPEGDAAALFEEASAHDFLGEEAAAIPLYRRALEVGLDEPRRSQAVIQLASSLRNVGDARGAVELLVDFRGHESVGDASDAFLALALHDVGRHADALRVALNALAKTLPQYGRAVVAYSKELS